MQNTLLKLHNNKYFGYIVTVIIVFSTLLIGVKTYNIGYILILEKIETAITIFFLFEIILRFIICTNKKRFFYNFWNVFHSLIVIISIIAIEHSEYVFLARLSYLRVLHIIDTIPDLRLLINTLIRSLPSMGYLLFLMFTLFYMYAAVGSFIFEDINPNLWGNISISMLTLFQVITFGDWAKVMYETMEIHPWSWIYYLSFIFLNGFIFLNMMIAIAVDKIQQEHERLSALNKN